MGRATTVVLSFDKGSLLVAAVAAVVQFIAKRIAWLRLILDFGPGWKRLGRRDGRIALASRNAVVIIRHDHHQSGKIAESSPIVSLCRRGAGRSLPVTGANASGRHDGANSR